MKLLSLRSCVLAAVAAVIIGFTGNALAGAPTGLRFQLTPKLGSFAWYFYYSSVGEGASSVTSWKVEYGLQSDFSDAVVSKSGTSATVPTGKEVKIYEQTVSQLVNGTTYYVRGTVVNNLGEEAVLTGTVTTLEKKPDAFTKFAVTSTGFTSALFSRELILGEAATATTVWMDYGTDPGLADCRVFTEMLSWNKAKTTWTVEGLLPNTTYYARLRSTNTNKMDAQSEVVTFTTAAEGAVAPSVTTNGIYEILVYTKSGWYVAQEDETVEYLVVGGGGGSGGYIGGGAGGGGVIHVTETNLTAGTYAVGVGTGGAAGSGGKNGGDSYFADSYAFGGGASGYWDHNYANAGGSGGGSVRKGASGAGVEGQGFAGGNSTSVDDITTGGGGATEPGGTGDTKTRVAGKGGDGYDCNITGEWHCYGSGGGGGDIIRNATSRTYAAPGGKESGGHGRTQDGTVSQTEANGVDGLGGGGGGGCYITSSDTGGKGGSGTVIIKRVWMKASPSPTVTKAPVVDKIGRSSATVTLFVDMLGAEATSADVRFFVAPAGGAYPAEPSAVKTITADGSKVAVEMSGVSTESYKAYFQIVNDKGLSVDSEEITFTLLGQHLIATGSDLTYDDGDYRVMVFTNWNESANLVVTTGGPADVLLVGGGGGGGGIGGGGGGGGVIALTNIAIVAGTYPVLVGKGGAAGKYSNLRGGMGGDTSFYGRTAFGGGGGGTWDCPGGWTGMAGGSGGGGSATEEGGKGIDGQGHKGGQGGPVQGTVCGGGGGAMQDGGLGTATAGSGKGGDGLVTDISGEEHCYGSGGGGGAHSNRNTEIRAPGGRESGGAGGANGPTGADKNGLNGVDMLGGGGGGGGQGGLCGAGGSGVVIIRFKWRNGLVILLK